MPLRVSSAAYTQSAQQRTNKPSDTVDGRPKPSSVLFSKTPPTKFSATNQNAWGSDGSHVGQSSLVNSSADNRHTPSGDGAKNQSPTKNIYTIQDTTATSNGALTNTELPYPREV